MAQQILLAPPSERTLSQAESIAVVQIFLNASLACIAHTRELIPWTSPCFRTRYVDQITLEDDPPAGGSLYSAFQALTSLTAGEGQEIKLLVRGGHQRADQILDMLEQGVFDALHRNYLESLRVFVTKATGSNQEIVETYHFTFAYERDRIISVRLSLADHAFVLENVHKSFKAAIRALLRSLRNLPRLPARRKLGMSLTYNETCPMVYQPPGFIDKDEYQEEEGHAMCGALLKQDDDVVGILECGHHRVRVAVRVQSAAREEPSIDLQDTEMSRQLQAMQKTSSSQSNNLLSTLRDSLPVSKRPRDGPIPSAKRLRASDPEKSSSEQPITHGVGINLPTGLTPLEKQTFTVLRSGQDGNTSKDPSAPSSPKAKGLNLRITKLTELLIHCYAIQSGKAGECGNAFDQDLLAEGKIKRLNRSSRINCECGSQQRSSSMLYCEVCDGWQHSKCYGRVESVTSATVPAEHFCYTCLLFSEGLEPPNSPLLIILLRMAVGYLTTQTTAGLQIDGSSLQMRLKSPRWTKKVLDYTIQRLVEESLLVPRAGELFEVRSLSESEKWQVKERCMSSLASIKHLYETDPDIENTQDGKNMGLLKAYASGNAYTTAERCEKLIAYDDFGDPVVRWGYRLDATIPSPEDSVVEGGTATPVRPRRISISRTLIDIGCSPSAASMSFEESTSRSPKDGGCDTDCSTPTSTATAD
ncbi:HORMA domain-containing protein [Cladophialophora immunda]|nr:HORMA domain-containing protein [Cladophialophora immunda]